MEMILYLLKTLNIFLLIIISVIVYILALLLLKVLTEDEILMLKSIF